MGTRSTVKFYNVGGKQKELVMSIYQQFDGYPEGVGRQVYDLLSNIKVVNGFNMEAKLYEEANGVEDLALQYVAKYKDRVGNMYATTADDVEEWNYDITCDERGHLMVEVYRGNWDGEKTGVEFMGSVESFGEYVKENEEYL